MENTIFKDVIDNNQGSSEDLTIYASIQVDSTNNSFSPGIEIEVKGLEVPLFLSSFELRALADEADNMAQKMIGYNENTVYH